MTRRDFIKWSAVGGAGLAAGRGLRGGAGGNFPDPGGLSAGWAGGVGLDAVPGSDAVLVDYAVDATGGGTVRASMR